MTKIDPAEARMAPGNRVAHMSGQLMLQDEPVRTELDAAWVLHAVFPNMPIAMSDILPFDGERSDDGIWEFPVPAAVAAIVLTDHEDFGWTSVVTVDEDTVAKASVLVVSGFNY